MFSENIALNKPAYQQHPYSGPIPSYLTQASNAVDGLYGNVSVWGGQCAYSDDGQETAIFWINLTRIYNIYSIDITYMRGDSPWGLFIVYFFYLFFFFEKQNKLMFDL